MFAHASPLPTRRLRRLLSLILLLAVLLSMFVPAVPAAQAQNPPPVASVADAYTVTAITGFWPYALNDLGQMAGVVDMPYGSAAAIWDKGVATQLLQTASNALGINNSGVVTVNSGDRAYTYSAGVFTPITPADPPPDQQSIVYASGGEINASGQVAATIKGNGAFVAAILQADRWSYLPALTEQRFGSASSINDLGEVAGHSNNTDGYSQATLWANGAPINLGNLGSNRSFARDVNNRSEVVGNSEITSGSRRIHAFVWRGGQLTSLGALPRGGDSDAFAINDQGLIVGEAEDANFIPRAVAWVDGTIVDLNSRVPADSGIVLLAAMLINNQGQIVVRGRLNTVPAFFLLTPEAGGELTDLTLQRQERDGDAWFDLPASANIGEGTRARLVASIRKVCGWT